MAEDNKAFTPDGAEHAQGPDNLTEHPPAPDAPEVSAPPAPNMEGGDVVVPSNVIDGLFEEKRTAAQEAEKQAAGEQPPEKKEARRGRPPKADRPEKTPDADSPEKKKRGGRPPKGDKQAASMVSGGASGKSAGKEDAAPVVPDPPPPPRDATRPGDTEQIVYIAHADLHPFKGHPFEVREDEAMKSLAESVKERGFDQPALVRPREGGGYELVAGHRRQHAAELAGYTNLPCVVRNLTDDEAVLAMTESNLTTRESILPSERAKALQMQLEAIKHQGGKSGELKNGEFGKRSNEIIADRNQMSIKNVQRYISLNNLVPDLMQQVDDKKIKFSAAVDLSFIKPKNQRYIAVAITGALPLLKIQML